MRRLERDLDLEISRLDVTPDGLQPVRFPPRPPHDRDPVGGAGRRTARPDRPRRASRGSGAPARRSSSRRPPRAPRAVGQRPVGELLEPALGLLGRRAFCVSLAHQRHCHSFAAACRGTARASTNDARRSGEERRSRRACRRSSRRVAGEHLRADDLEHERARRQERRDAVEADPARPGLHRGPLVVVVGQAAADRRTRRARRARTRSSARRSRRSGSPIASIATHAALSQAERRQSATRTAAIQARKTSEAGEPRSRRRARCTSTRRP